MRSPLISDLLREMLLALARLHEPAYLRVRPASSARGRDEGRDAA